MIIAVVEDDYFQATAIEDVLYSSLHQGQMQIRRYATAVEAIESIDAGEWDGSVSGVVLDRMLKWCPEGHASASSSAPRGVARGDAVLRAILSRTLLKRTPIALLSINRGPIDSALRRSNVTLLGKTASLVELSDWSMEHLNDH